MIGFEDLAGGVVALRNSARHVEFRQDSGFAQNFRQIAKRVEADSCSGDEFMPAECRVAEASETNNFSARFVVALP